MASSACATSRSAAATARARVDATKQRANQTRGNVMHRNARSMRARTRAVVDNDTETNDKPASRKASAPRPDTTLRPAGVSDAVVDSSKALEALARLGGNRTFCASASATRDSVVFNAGDFSRCWISWAIFGIRDIIARAFARARWIGGDYIGVCERTCVMYTDDMCFLYVLTAQRMRANARAVF